MTKDEDFAILSGKPSGAIFLTTLVLQRNGLELFREFFGSVRVNFWLCESNLAPDCGPLSSVLPLALRPGPQLNSGTFR